MGVHFHNRDENQQKMGMLNQNRNGRHICRMDIDSRIKMYNMIQYNTMT